MHEILSNTLIISVALHLIVTLQAIFYSNRTFMFVKEEQEQKQKHTKSESSVVESGYRLSVVMSRLFYRVSDYTGTYLAIVAILNLITLPFK